MAGIAIPAPASISGANVNAVSGRVRPEPDREARCIKRSILSLSAAHERCIFSLFVGVVQSRRASTSAGIDYGRLKVQRPAGLAGSNLASVGVLAPIATSAKPVRPLGTVFGMIR